MGWHQVFAHCGFWAFGGFGWWRWSPSLWNAVKIYMFSLFSKWIQVKLKAWKSEAYGAKLKSYVVQHSALDSIYTVSQLREKLAQVSTLLFEIKSFWYLWVESLVFKTCPLIPQVGFKTLSIYYIEFPWMQNFFGTMESFWWQIRGYILYSVCKQHSMTASRNPKHGE